jgi:DNA-damage-inducible protein J
VYAALVTKKTMATTTKSSVQVRLDEDLKRDAEAVFDNLGVDAPTAIRMFFKKVVATRSIPFVVEENPYRFTPEEEAEILQAAEESYDPKNLDGPFHSAKEAIEFLRASARKA